MKAIFWNLSDRNRAISS